MYMKLMTGIMMLVVVLVVDYKNFLIELHLTYNVYLIQYFFDYLYIYVDFYKDRLTNH